MKKLITLILAAILGFWGCKENVKKEMATDAEEPARMTKTDSVSAKFSIEIIDEAALAIIDPQAKIEILASGFMWTEGPLWIENGNYLLFSDIPRNKIYKLDDQNDTLTFLHPSGFSGSTFTGGEPGSNGLLLNAEGELVLMQHGNRQVAKMDAPLKEAKPDFSTLAGTYLGKRLNSPNDGCFDALGNLYFTDPPYGLPKLMDDPEKELDFQGVYCLLKTGDLALIDDALTRPNGIGLSPNGRYLYVAVSDPKEAAWYRYTVESPGKVGEKTKIADATHLVETENEPGLPDGLKINSAGIIFATGPGGVWIMDPDGKLLARIKTGQATANCAFGKDQRHLFLTADDYVLAVGLK